MKLCPRCRRHVRTRELSCPFCAVVLGSIFLVACAKQPEAKKPEYVSEHAIYGGPPPDYVVYRVPEKTTLDTFQKQLEDYGCTVTDRTAEYLRATCPESAIGFMISKDGTNLTCDRSIGEDGCRALYQRISTGQKPVPSGSSI